ncbi:MAG: SpoIIE family protein phosphatase [Melioribacteraceae bacterium]|nr:SpoIIE family protein phosphatase [Melioribacteraceae bacterium]MCF8355336.1 SpoIIE family protein phosphatase [Melioribacteraceae bacterium]MCF8392350.1 SpoIIE family protein phosphatase [Melioribacteraceae bacterium]MCF8417870.1 SpoIIE family protein phosphatase [Melioribacteraceae bacterium]
MQYPDKNAALRNLSALVDFSNLINSSLDLNFTLNNMLLTCFSKLLATKGLIALNSNNNSLEVKTFKGFSKDIISQFPNVSIDDFENNPDFKNFAEENNIRICQKIVSSNNKLGVLCLGQRMGGSLYDEDDKSFLQTIVNIGATAIENSQIVEELKSVNKRLDAKVNQLGSLFDLSKEFSGILKVEMVGKLLVFSIIGQLLVSKFAVVTCENNSYRILETKIPEEKLKGIIKDCNLNKITSPIRGDELNKEFEDFRKVGIELVIPMTIKSETKGLILLGRRKNEVEYTQSDIEFVSSVGSLAIISIENARLFEEAIEKQRLEKDLEIARNIQRNLLPGRIPQLKNFEIAAFNKSARQVGGDYYDVVTLDDHRTLIAIADVSGKGVQAALLMANLQAFLKSICKQNIPINEASNLINDLVSENTTMGSFITFFWGIIDDEARTLTYVNAGHNPPLLVRDNEIIKLRIGGMILGVMSTTIPYESEEIELRKGDRIYLFTDGITEAMSMDNEEFSDEKLEDFVLNQKDLSADELINSLMKEVRNYTAGADQSDDITSLILKVN